MIIKTKIMILTLFITGCAATAVLNKEAGKIRIINTEPDKKNCKYIGEIIGSQGNWASGDFTSNENLLKGARNDLRNKAYKLGGNLIHIQRTADSAAWGSMGTTSTQAVGDVYTCTNVE